MKAESHHIKDSDELEKDERRMLALSLSRLCENLPLYQVRALDREIRLLVAARRRASAPRYGSARLRLVRHPHAPLPQQAVVRL